MPILPRGSTSNGSVWLHGTNIDPLNIDTFAIHSAQRLELKTTLHLSTISQSGLS